LSETRKQQKKSILCIRNLYINEKDTHAQSFNVMGGAGKTTKPPTTMALSHKQLNETRPHDNKQKKNNNKK